ncbi:MAG: putative alpha-1,2-mannosidase [Polaribacter sp.]|jgi:predicted alpha-1,2-mannosidase
MKYITILCLFIGLLFSACKENEKTTTITNNNTLKSYNSLTDYVNPFIGTGGHGHTFPGATMPFGMVQLSPDTRLTGWDGCGGYHYTDSIVYGFSHTHLSGTGVPDYGDILLMPVLESDLHMENGADGEVGYKSPFSKSKEIAEAGYYQTHLDRYDIDVRLTASTRAGMHEYNFPKDRGNGVVIVDLEHRDEVLKSSFEKINNREVAGSRISNAWAREQHVYFVIQFSKDITKVADRESQNGSVHALSFDTSDGESLLAKVGISAVSIEGARKNLEAEMPDFNFEKYKKAAQSAWEKQLAKIEVEGGTEEERTIFYTALYHTMVVPNIYQDVDGQYRGMDLKVHKDEEDNHTHYTVFSLWDTYRAANPLYTLIEPTRTNDFISTLLDGYEKGGILPIWELSGNYTGCMIGYHAIPVIADAYKKGIRNYDTKLALKAMQHSATQDHLGLEAYKELGYIPAERESESVSKTLEYAYDDWCIAQMAKEMGEEKVYEEYIKRAQYYKNIYDPQTGFMRSKNNNSWVEPFDPTEVNFHFTEANCWQYSFYVPQDVDGLAQSLGGNKALEAKLDELFTTSSETSGRDQVDITGLVGQYAHGNEPSHHMAYLYNYVETPWKTQEMVRRLMDEMYHNLPDGLSGNEDCGQMSAWYVLSSMGFYPVTPASNTYVIGSPVFDKVTVNLENGKHIVINANNNGAKNVYVQSLQVNGSAYEKTYINHEDLANGAELTFEMGSVPNKKWGASDEAAPTSAIKEHLIMPLPFVAEGSRVFKKETIISLNSKEEDVTIYYTMDGSKPTAKSAEYKKSLPIKETTMMSFFARKKGLPDSKVVTATFMKIHEERSIELKTKYASPYSASGNDALIDLLRGGSDFRTGTWQGYEGKDLDATVDLGSVLDLKTIALSCLQDQNSWIFMPTEVQYETSVDGKKFKALGTYVNEIDRKEDGSIIQSFEIIANTRARYIRVKAYNAGLVPNWHKGAGGKSWLFADEILVTTK